MSEIAAYFIVQQINDSIMGVREETACLLFRASPGFSPAGSKIHAAVDAYGYPVYLMLGSACQYNTEASVFVQLSK